MSKGSAKTSRPIVPTGAKYVDWQRGQTNLDFGGGKYENFTQWLLDRGVINLVFDKYNRTPEHNRDVLAVIKKSKADTGTLFNVLNVIPSGNEMINALRALKMMVSGNIYISVYEGDGRGVGKYTRDGYQQNKKLVAYLPIVKKVFPKAKKIGAIIISNTLERPVNENPVPPKTVSKTACRGLAKRRKYKRGGTSVGVARARDLCNRVNVSMRTVKRMSSYFARHRASRATNAKRINDPTSPASIADDLWGGTAGMNWARSFKPR